MISSTRIIASLTALVAAVCLSTLASGGAAMATPSKIPPITTLTIPQVKVTVGKALLQPGDPQNYVVTAHMSDGSALSGRIDLTLDRHDGMAPAHIWTATSLGSFVGGRSDMLTAAVIGDDTLTAVYTAGLYQPGAKGSANFQVRALGPSLAVATGSAVAGTATSVKTTVTVPFGGHPIGGRVGIQVGALGEKASCLPTAVTATTAACTANLPASLAAGPYALTVIWTDSPSFVTANYATTFTIAKAPVAAPIKKGGSSSVTPAPTTPTPAPATAPATPTAAPTPSASSVAVVPGSDGPSVSPKPNALPVTTASSTVPLWGGIAIAILLVAFLVIALLVVIAIVRSRRARTAA